MDVATALKRRAVSHQLNAGRGKAQLQGKGGVDVEWGGYTGAILRVDLSTGKITREAFPAGIARDFLGARGAGVRLAYDEIKPGINPLGLDNPLIFMTGPLTGTGAPMTSRYSITTRSPLTGIYLTTLAGGFFPAELKFAGYDGLIVQGKSTRPTYLSIHDDVVELRSAEHLWGRNTSETQTAIAQELQEPRVKVACIGLAGENLVPYASVISDRRAAGRGGAGAVMASKNLKGIAVRGSNKCLPISRPNEYKAAVAELNRLLKDDALSKGLAKYGTPLMVDVMNSLGIFPTNNYQDAYFENAENLNGDYLLENFVVGDHTCYGCWMKCTKVSRVKDGIYQGAETEGPEYETVYSFGSACGNDSMAAIIKADFLCDEYGMDTVSAGVAIGFAMELYEKGLITKEDTGGLDLRFGNHEAMVEMVHKIARREGLGDLLAQGTRKAAEEVGQGSEKFAMHVKGMEIPAYDPRGAKGMAITYATGPRGGCHCRGYTVLAETGKFPGLLPGVEIDRFSDDHKGFLAATVMNRRAMSDSMTACSFATNAGWTSFRYLDILNAATGRSLTLDEFYTIGERINNLERCFNAREGLGRKDDTLPQRLLTDPIKTGPSKGHIVEDLDRLLDDYYQERGWDLGTGKPKKEKLDELGLGFAVDDIWP